MATLNVRVDEELKKQASELFSSLGLDMSTAVNMFLRQAVMRDGIPFDVVRTNAETLAEQKLFEEIELGRKSAEAQGYISFADSKKAILG